MPQIKIATFNIEWMISIFGGEWTTWDGTIPDSFAGKRLGSIELEPIDDVPGLCKRIAAVIKEIDAKIIAVQEGPPRKDQMELFVKQFLGNRYVVHTSNSRTQTLHFLVHTSIAGKITSFDAKGPETKLLRGSIPFYPWGMIQEAERKTHRFFRTPLVLTFTPANGKTLRIINVHTKSKFSKLKKPEQWLLRDEEAIVDALLARQKLSAEIVRLREFAVSDLGAASGAPDGTIIVGDFNDGAYAELMEREFLIHNIVDELVGSFLQPKTYFEHAMTPSTIAKSSTVTFPDPLEGGKLVDELIDHVVVSPTIWQTKKPFKLKAGSCRVEKQAYDRFDDTGQIRKRGDRPSDHRPVSFVVEY